MCPYSLDSQGSREFIEGLGGRCMTSAWFTHHMPNSELFQLEGHDGQHPTIPSLYKFIRCRYGPSISNYMRFVRCS